MCFVLLLVLVSTTSLTPSKCRKKHSECFATAINISTLFNAWKKKWIMRRKCLAPDIWLWAFVDQICRYNLWRREKKHLMEVCFLWPVNFRANEEVKSVLQTTKWMLGTRGWHQFIDWPWYWSFGCKFRSST